MLENYFAAARERHAIYLRRKRGDPPPWTRDRIYYTFKFTNVFRELDYVTQWFRQHVRDPMRDQDEVLLATVLFRWFNLPKTGEAIFLQHDLLSDGKTAWGALLEEESTEPLMRAIRAYCGKGPYISSAYMIKSPDGMDKVTGILTAVDRFMRNSSWRDVAQQWRNDPEVRLQLATRWLAGFDFQGPFMAYEVISDLRHTALLEHAVDTLTWANPGPGAKRGLNRLHGRMLRETIAPDQMLREMREVLEASRDPRNWPQRTGQGYIAEGYVTEFAGEGDWPAWEMREVEHWLCEFDKYRRTELGEGYPKNNFKPRIG